MRFNDIDNCYIGSSAVSRVLIGSVEVWTAVYAPSVITDFAASDATSTSLITCTWSTADADPVATYNLINDTTEETLATGISSGYQFPWIYGALNLRVDAINSEGTTSSNVNAGSILVNPGSALWTSVTSTSWVVPNGVFSVTLCMIGGGGSGAQNYTTAHRGGGYAGTIISQAVAVTPGTSLSVVVGGGGAAQTSNQGAGATGGQSKFGALTANGGAGGASISANQYAGNGQSRVTCYGTAYNGTLYDSVFYGGQAGFGNGGQGGSWNNAGRVAGAGVRGGGGGGGDARISASGAGGTGVVKITWA